MYMPKTILNNVYLAYLRIKYIPKLIKAKYKAGLFESNITTIKHVPANITGTIESYVDKTHAKFLQTEYKLKQNLKEQKKQIKQLSKKSLYYKERFSKSL